MDDIHEKLRKLLALAEQGIGGEKTNARKLLEALMRKHDITLDQLTELEPEMHWFKRPKGQHKYQLLLQVIAAVSGQRSTYTNKLRKNQIAAKVTKSEKLEIELRQSIYAAALTKELDICFTAFIHQNNIFSNQPASDEPSKRSEEELRRIALAMLGMTKVPIHRQLANDGKD